jgi:hypothetical protein
MRLLMLRWRWNIDEDGGWPVLLVTNECGNPPDNWDVHVVGTDLGWPGNLLDGLKDQRDNELVLLLQEDFFPNGEMDMTAISTAEDIMDRNPNIGCLRLMPCPGPEDETRVAELSEFVPVGEIHRGEPYRISCQAAIWHVGFLRRCLRLVEHGTKFGGPEHRINGFELEGTEASVAWPERVLCVLRSAARWPLPYMVTGIVHGKWSRAAVKAIVDVGCAHVLGKRPVEEA